MASSLLDVTTYKNPFTGIPAYVPNKTAQYWVFNTDPKFPGAVQWTSADYSMFHTPLLDWQMEQKPWPINAFIDGDNVNKLSQCVLPIYGLALGNLHWNGSAPFTDRNSQWRSSHWGRVSPFGGNDHACPANLSLKIGGKHYTIPDLWIRLSNTGEIAVNSNWKDYAPYMALRNGSTMECYGYENGDVTKPVVLRFTATYRMANTQGVVFTGVEVDRAISGDLASVTAFQDEFNWRLAAVRFNAACAGELTPNGDKDGYLGWLGQTDHIVQSFLKAGDVPLGQYGDPLVMLGAQDVTCSVKDLYVVSVNNSNETVDYVQTFTLQNSMDNQQTLKTNDYSWAHTDTTTFTWGMQEQISLKVTVKWEFDISASIIFAAEKMKFSFQFEAGYTHTFSQSWTDTHTDTRTLTLAGQSVVLPAKSAAHINAVLIKVDGSGVLGQAVQIAEDPGVKMCPTGLNMIQNSLYDAKIDLAAAAKALGMKSIVSEYKMTQGPDKGKTVVGAFAKPTMNFQAKYGAAGTAEISPAPYVAPREAPMLSGQMSISGSS